MIVIVGYLGIVILCSVIFVGIILIRPDRNQWSLEEESEALLPCKHEFKPKEVIDLTIDPKCVHCGESLSELEKQLKQS